MKKNKCIAALLSAVLLLTCISCGIAQTETEFVPDQPEVLTHVYLGEKIELPDGYEFCNSVTPLYKDGIFTVLCRDGDDGIYSPSKLVSFDENGKIIGEEVVNTDFGNVFYEGIIREEYIVVSHGEYGIDENGEKIRTRYLSNINRTDSNTATSDDLICKFNSPYAYDKEYRLLGFERDGDGYYYFFSETELVVLDSDFNHVLTYPASGITESFAVRPDGKLTVYSSFTRGSGLYTPNPETKIPDTVIKTGTDETITDHWYDPDGNMYIKDDTGYYALTENGCELLMDFRNSGITAERLDIYNVPNCDIFLGGVAKYGSFASGEVSLQIFRKSEDIVVSKIEVIDLATLGEFDQYIAVYVTDYNLMHRDRRIVVTDFGEMENGEMHLMTGIQTGTYQPDMIIGAPESPVIRKIVESGLYVDLLPYLEKDDLLNTSNLFGAVKRIFSHDEKMWGISPKITVKTVIASVGKLGNKNHWSLDELLDYAENLPEDEYLMRSAIRTKADEYILGPAGYSMFVDFESGTASFDSELFARYLEYAASLPDDYATSYGKISGFRLEILQSGKVTLDNARDMTSFHDLLDYEACFPQDGYTIIGYPSKNDASSYATAESAYVITSFASDSDEMWEILKELFPMDSTSPYYKAPNGFPSMKNIYDIQAAAENRMEYIVKFSGGIGGHSYDPANPMKPEALTEPAIITYFDETKAAALREFLDNRCGMSVMDTLPAELDAIIREEISAYFGGMGTEKDCAKKIQSRVELWLAEHES